MIPFEILIAIIIFAFVSSITPGPNNIMLLASGTNYGFKRTIPHLFGIFIGFSFLLLSIGFGLSQIFDYFPISKLILKISCGIYLTYLSYKIATASSFKNDTETKSKPFTIRQAALFQWVNPKAWIMAMSAISVYAPNHEFSTILVITAAFVLINIPCQCLWTYAGEQLSHLLNNSVRLRIFNYIMALLLMFTLIEILIIKI